MDAVTSYAPSGTVKAVLAVAADEGDTEKLLCIADILIRIVARELADAECADAPTVYELRSWVRYFEDAPETRSLVLRLMQSVRADWMRDPS